MYKGWIACVQPHIECHESVALAVIVLKCFTTFVFNDTSKLYRTEWLRTNIVSIC